MSEYDLLKTFGLSVLKKIKTVVTNKYLLAIAIFFFLSFFLMENTYIDRWSNYNKIRELNEQVENYDKQIAICNKKIEELNTDNIEALERFAREEYYMKRKNEEIFIIEDEE